LRAVQSGDLVLTMGAGSISGVPAALARSEG
jgi:UDP-N-acetylmuramate-alanine ligase